MKAFNAMVHERYQNDGRWTGYDPSSSEKPCLRLQKETSLSFENQTFEASETMKRSGSGIMDCLDLRSTSGHSQIQTALYQIAGSRGRKKEAGSPDYALP